MCLSYWSTLDPEASHALHEVPNAKPSSPLTTHDSRIHENRVATSPIYGSKLPRCPSLEPSVRDPAVLNTGQCRLYCSASMLAYSVLQLSLQPGVLYRIASGYGMRTADPSQSRAKSLVMCSSRPSRLVPSSSAQAFLRDLRSQRSEG
ncbi:hypothetical protein E4U25_004835 [Claviceps purpurea]|nr:hypothetical protein E4U25_004835 [Claviceps purpurea]